MTTQTTNRHASIRAYVVALAVLLTSMFATSTASASTLIPQVDIGAPGGGGGIAAQTTDIANSDIPGLREF